MKGYTFVFATDSMTPEDREWTTEDPGLKFLQEAVGGYIESVPFFTSVAIGDAPGKILPCIAYCNEYGKIERLPMNRAATMLWDAAVKRLVNEDGSPRFPKGLMGPGRRGWQEILVGPICIVAGDKAFMRRHTGKGE